MRNITARKDLDSRMLSLIEDQLNHEALLYKKYLDYGALCYDGEIKRICYLASQSHKTNYERILSYLHG